MAWYDEAVFYHIYPLGMTGAPKTNSYGEPEHRLNKLLPWISHIRKIGCNALYIGPLFESVGHGYETTDYRKLDSRLGDNEDLKNFVKECHAQGIRVILDGVFNHVGRDFFAFQDLKERREQSEYKDWFCNVNFWGNNEYNDGFSYDNWGGYNLLVKLNQKNPAVCDYICDVIRFWVREFEIDGIRLDAADVLDFGFMQQLRRTANEVKPEFWLMGEVIHGDYTRWVNEGTLHSVTNYHLHKALYSGHNDHNYFEIAHTVRRQCDLGGNRSHGLKLYNFVDNHDVERIYTKLRKKAHFVPVHILLYTLPGIPSIYYGSEFGIEGKKERYSDDSLRPKLQWSDYENALEQNFCTKVVAALGRLRQNAMALAYGDYRELLLTTTQYAFSRNWNGQIVVTTVNNSDDDVDMSVRTDGTGGYVGMLTGKKAESTDGWMQVSVKGNSGEVWISEELYETMQKEDSVGNFEDVSETEKPEHVSEDTEREETSEKESQTVSEIEKVEHISENEDGKNRLEMVSDEDSLGKDNILERMPEESQAVEVPADKPYEEMTVEELQQAILNRMAQNGPVTDRMKQDVYENIWQNSLLNWIRSFR